jgi:putative ABC transport system permease protein
VSVPVLVHDAGASIRHPASRIGLVIRLAVADLRHDWVMAASLIVAIGAVITPLLLVLGLKYGLVEFQRQRLVQDPVYREIRPTQVREFPDEFFAQIRVRPDVGFILPSILRGASSVSATAGGDQRVQLDLLPTAAGDPLLRENGAPVPREGEVVVSQAAAERLRVAAGGSVTLAIDRRFQSRSETVTAVLRVVGVLQPRADPLDRIYVPFSLAEDIEGWREGKAVPMRGWGGGVAVPYASYDGVLAVTQRALPATEENRLQINTGIGRVQRLSEADGLALLPRSTEAEPGASFYQLATIGTPLLAGSLGTLGNMFRPYGAILLPTVVSLEAQLPASGVPTGLRVAAVSLADETARRLGIAPLPWGRSPIAEQFHTLNQILLPPELQVADGTQITLRMRAADGPWLDLPLRAVGAAPAGGPAIVPAELAGILRTAAERRVVMSAEYGVPVLGRPAYRGFRLYARGIEDVAGLSRFFNEAGIEIAAQLGDIQRVQSLDRGLTRLFWLVATVGMLGGIASLAASLHAAVQRKRRDFGMLRLMGLPKGGLLGFPLAQSLAVALLSFGLALAGFFVCSNVINTVFAADLPLGHRLCYLPPGHMAAAGALTVVLSALSAIRAGVVAMRIDPAEAIRVE